MARRKSFTTKPAVADDNVEIEINGTVFPCTDIIPGQVMLDFLAQMDMDDPASLAKSLDALFAAALMPEHLEAWKAFTRDPVNRIDIEKLSEIAGWLAEEFSGRPT